MSAHFLLNIRLPHDSKAVDVRSDTLEHVLWFATEMEHKLSLNRHKGDSPGWLVCNPLDLLMRLRQEVEELTDALNATDKRGAIEECADVANFAMMIADIMRDSMTDDVTATCAATSEWPAGSCAMTDEEKQLLKKSKEEA